MRGGEGPLSSPTDSRGQSETIATVLILAITIIGATVALAFGATALNDARIDSHQESVKNALTQLDSQTARVALGESSVQSVALAAGDYHVDPDSGWIRLTHHNYSGDGDDEILYNDSLGAVIYDGEEVSIAYQGGGVWQTADNGSTMVSPPEFHYRGATLTLPIVQLTVADSAAGPTRARITSTGTLTRIYPNGSDNYPITGDVYANPVSAGNITATVHSDHYQAWAEYFRSRTEGDVTVHHSNNTVTVELFTPSVVGDFGMPSEGNGLTPNAVGDEHPLQQFEITLKPDPHFNNMHWSFYADEGAEEFELHIHSPTQCSGGSYDGELDISVYYYNGSAGTYEGWQNSSIDPDTSSFVDVDCANEELTIDFLGTTPLTYGAITLTGGDSKWHYGDEISSMSVDSVAVFDQHDIDDDAGDRDGDYSTGETEEMGFVIDHYFEILGPNFELIVTDGPGGSSRVDEGDSSGTLDYESGTGRFITFLHVTENRVTIELE